MTTEAAKTEYPYLLPQPDEHTQPFWDALKQHRLVMQRCTDCGKYRNPPQKTCRWCLGENYEWAPLSGRGTIYTYILVWQPVLKQWREAGPIPYNIIQVLPEEVEPSTVSVHNNNTFNVFYGNLADAEALKVGLPVEAVYDDVTEDVTILRWKPR